MKTLLILLAIAAIGITGWRLWVIYQRRRAADDDDTEGGVGGGGSRPPTQKH